jgi:four helix bundle protein
MRRAAASIPANIAEGCGRTSYADFARFLHIALGPASELDYFLILAHDLRFMEQADHDETLERIQEGKPMLSALIGHVRSELKTDN